MTPDKIYKSYYPALDGLRGFATVLVVLYHYLGRFPFFHFGWTGIELFFVLSGFLISARLIPFLNKKKLLPKFYWNRFLRIVPLYFTFLIIFFLSWFFFASPETQRDNTFYQKHYWQFFLFVQNWVYIFNFSLPNNHLQHLWSLAVEEQIYLVYPVLLLLFYKRTSFLFGVLSIIFLIAASRTVYYEININTIDYRQIYWNTIFRFDSFLCGVVIYFLYTNYQEKYFKWIRLFGIASITILVTGILITAKVDKDNPFFTTFGRTILALTFSYILWLCLDKKSNWMKKIFQTKFLVFTGKISYGIFIFHWPLFLTGFAVLNKITARFGLSTDSTSIYFANVIVCMFLTYLLSFLSFKYYESWFLQWKKK